MLQPMNIPLQKEFDYYIANQQQLVENYNGKVIVIKDQKVIGVYDNILNAIQDSQINHELGTFLVQKVEPGSDSYTQTYHSRVVFS
ncbi:MAG: hypothetical protein K2P74_08725 [Nitrosomonas sp.]|nr:hypothetical protein [Nitrosomonas sp.]